MEGVVTTDCKYVCVRVCVCRTVLHGGQLPGGPPVDPLRSDQLHREERMMRQYEAGSAPSDVTSEETEGEAHGWLIARLAPYLHLSHCLVAAVLTVLLQCTCLCWYMFERR